MNTTVTNTIATTNLFNDVRDFNAAMSVYMRPEGDHDWIADYAIELALELIDEETQELLDAIEDRDRIKIADGAIDSLYVVIGFATRLGYRPLFDTMPLCYEHSPSFPDTSERLGDLRESVASLRMYRDQLHASVKIRDLQWTFHAIESLYGELLVLTISIFDLPIDELWQEVHTSNMSKRTGSKVLKNQAGKVLKPPTWQPPKIDDILTRHGWTN